MMTLSHSSDRD